MIVESTYGRKGELEEARELRPGATFRVNRQVDLTHDYEVPVKGGRGRVLGSNSVLVEGVEYHSDSGDATRRVVDQIGARQFTDVGRRGRRKVISWIPDQPQTTRRTTR